MLTYAKRLPLPKVLMDFTKKPLTPIRISEIFGTQDSPKKSNQTNVNEKSISPLLKSNYNEVPNNDKKSDTNYEYMNKEPKSYGYYPKVNLEVDEESFSRQKTNYANEKPDIELKSHNFLRNSKESSSKQISNDNYNERPYNERNSFVYRQNAKSGFRRKPSMTRETNYSYEKKNYGRQLNSYNRNTNAGSQENSLTPNRNYYNNHYFSNYGQSSYESFSDPESSYDTDSSGRGNVFVHKVPNLKQISHDYYQNYENDERGLLHRFFNLNRNRFRAKKIVMDDIIVV